MTAPKHSPARWTYGYNPYTVQSDSSPLGAGTEIPAYEIFDADSNKVFDTNEDAPADLQEANARRSCAAVNACAAISTEALEQGAVAEMLNVLRILEKRCEALGWSEPLMRIIEHALSLATAPGRVSCASQSAD
jgi:hypothetical protein